MNLCGLESTGFIISVGLTLLMAGVIVYYINTRIKHFQNVLEKQGSVLGQLINDVRSHIGGGSVTFGLATPEAEAAAAQDSQLINVSDNDNDSDDDDDDDDYDSDTDDDPLDNAQDNNTTNHVSDTAVTANDSNVTELRVIETNMNNNITITENPTNAPHPTTPVDDLSDDDDDDDDDDDSPSEETNNLIETLNPSTMETIGTLTINKISHKDIDNDIKGMKVGELREMAINEKKLSEEEVKAMRKPDLVNLLTND